MKKLSLKVVIPQIILAVVCIASAAWGISSMHSLKEESLSQSEENIAAIHSLDTLSTNFQIMQKLLLTHFLTGNEDQIVVVRNTIDETIADVENEIEEYQQYVSDAKEKENYAAFTEKYQELYELYMESLGLSEEEMKGDAIELANGDIATIEAEMEDMIATMIEDRQNNSDESLEQQADTFNQSMMINFIMIVLSVVISVLAILSCYITIVMPTKKSIHKLRGIITKMESNECDLSERIPVRTKDEIGQLVQGINAFLNTLQNVVGDISHSSGNLENVIADVTDSVESVNSSSRDVSEVMEQLAASMEEVSATISTVDESVENVEKSIREFAKTSESILNYSNAMQTRADGLEKNAIESQSVTDQMLGEIIDSLKAAIEHSRSVEKVKNLTDEILSISSQTNLLALNASIEAARAGEAGKGFAVVADEIRQLADDSRETANNIQTINESVIAAVNELSSNSNHIVEYIHEKILPDYDGFVDSGRQYNKDAIYVNKEMNTFAEKTESVLMVTENLVKSIEEISHVIEDSAIGVEDAAKGSSALAQEIQKIQQDMDISKDVALQMKDQCDRFENA
ncbi:MAG: methyl-accepting chemotaxis protein [Clostridiaceae bacterium]|nr:methyl-accepting chemotaxis protein [Clostridiaceae bacterium]